MLSCRCYALEVPLLQRCPATAGHCSPVLTQSAPGRPCALQADHPRLHRRPHDQVAGGDNGDRGKLPFVPTILATKSPMAAPRRLVLREQAAHSDCQPTMLLSSVLLITTCRLRARTTTTSMTTACCPPTWTRRWRTRRGGGTTRTSSSTISTCRQAVHLQPCPTRLPSPGCMCNASHGAILHAPTPQPRPLSAQVSLCPNPTHRSKRSRPLATRPTTRWCP